MKRVIFQTICLSLLSILIISCTQQEKKTTTSPEKEIGVKVNQSPLTIATPIDSATAVQWAHDWRKDHATWWSNNTQPYAYTLPKADFIAILAEDNVDSIRLYMGLKPTAGKTQELKLIVVGVDSNGNNLFNYSAGDKSYDLTAICPPICGNQNSPLNSGGQ